jgi:uncharacterized alpha-E superfamily protein
VDQLKRSSAGLSSRVAENLFWFGRYAERCDNTARLLRVALGASLTDQDNDDAHTAIAALAWTQGLVSREELADVRACELGLIQAAHHETRSNGLAANLTQLSRVAFGLRERMSQDNWRTLNRLLQDPAFGRDASLSDTLNWLDRAITGLMTLSGFALDGMTRDTGWRFLSIGRRIERLVFMTQVLGTALTEGRTAGLTWLLSLSDSIVTYRSRYMAQPEWLPVLDLLIRDGANPRSLMFLCEGVAGYLRKLELQFGPCGSETLSPFVAAFESLEADAGLRPENAELLNLITDLRGTALDLSALLARRFFNPADAGRHA